MKKYRLTDETIILNDRILHRIQALTDFGNVKKGDLGGFIEKEENLSQNGDCWVYNNAMVYDNAIVADNAVICNDVVICGNAVISGHAKVCNNAIIYNNAMVSDNAMVAGNVIVRDKAKVYGNVVIYGNAVICGNAKVKDIKDFIVFKNWWSSGRYFTWTRSNNMWQVGCFYGTDEELIKKAYNDSNISGEEYERVVKYVEEIRNS